MAAIQLAWKAITEIYNKYWPERNQPAPIPLLVFFDDVTGIHHMLPVIWDEEIDGDKMKATPFETLRSAVPEVIQGYPGKIDVSECKLFYKLGDDGIVPIRDDKTIANMLEQEPDYANGHRRVFIECPGVCPPNGQECEARSSDDSQTDDKYDNLQYQLALNAYRHAKGHQINLDEDKVEKYEEELEDLGLSGFVVKSHAIQLVHQDLDAYNEQIEGMGKAFNWNEKVMAAAKAGGTAASAVEADKQVEFDIDEWKLKGFLVRFASFLDDDGSRISYSVSTSKFEFNIPADERDQTFVEKFISGGGTVKRSFMRKINYLMQADGIQASNDNMMLPIPETFAKNKSK